MITKIKNGITNSIFSEFGEEYEIHTEKVDQDLSPGSFIVSCASPYLGKYIGELYKVDVNFMIHYFPKTDLPMEEMDEVFMRLSMCLTKIVLKSGEELPCIEISCKQKEEDIMTVSASYMTYVSADQVKDLMSAICMEMELEG